MFVHVEGRHKSAPVWAVVALICVCVATFLWLGHLPDSERTAFVKQWGTVPARLFDMQTPWLQQLLEWRWLRLITSLFIHAGWLHLSSNLLFLLIFGLSAERALGSARFLLLFFAGGALANLAEATILANTTAPIVGSSGAVSAVIGAYLGLFPRASLGLVLPLGMFLEFVRIPAPLLIGFWALLQVAFTFVGPAFPDREIVQVPCRPLIWQNGSLHCITMQLPAGLLAA